MDTSLSTAVAALERQATSCDRLILLYTYLHVELALWQRSMTLPLPHSKAAFCSGGSQAW